MSMEANETFRSSDRSSLILIALAATFSLFGAAYFFGGQLIFVFFLILICPVLALLLITAQQKLFIDRENRKIVQRSWQRKSIAIDEVVLCEIKELSGEHPPFFEVTLKTKDFDFKVKSSFISRQLISSLEQLFNGRFKREKIT